MAQRLDPYDHWYRVHPLCTFANTSLLRPARLMRVMDTPTGLAARQTAPSLKRGLIVLMAALGIPLITLQAWWGSRDYETARERAGTNALAIADATSLGVRQFLGQTESMMMAMADVIAGDLFGEGDAPTREQWCQRRVDRVAEVYPFLVNAMVVGPDASITCSHRELADPLPASEPWWDGYRERPSFRVGVPLEGPLSQAGFLHFVAPLTSASGEFGGALVGAVELVDLHTLFGTINLPEDYLVTVASADRVVIARSHDADNQIGRRLPDLSGSEELVGPGRAVAIGPDINGVPRTWGQVELPSGWMVYVGVPDEVVYAPARREWLANLALTLLFLLPAFVLAGYSYRGIGDALGELGRRTRELAEGKPVSVPSGTPSEVVEVVERFNEAMTEREQAQLGERRARERYQSIFDNVVFGLFVSTTDGRFLEVNPALATMLGYDSPEDLVEVGPAALYADPALHNFLLAQSLASGKVESQELDWVRADGNPITVRLTGKLIWGPGGDRAFEFVVQDITDERRREDELRQTQKMEAIGQLAGGIAHDFNNLLTVIRGNVELLEDDIPEDDPLRRDLSEISRATSRATSLTRRLLTFSRRKQQGGPLRDGNEVISGLAKLLGPLIGENVELRTELTGGPYPIALDPGEFEQIVLNLVLNARDAMPQGGTIRIATEAAEGETGEGDLVPGVRLSVSDDGLGIKPAIRQRIFEPFFTTKPMGQGTGLGLSTVYGIVKRVDGSMDVETVAGAGTTMRIWLPLTDTPDTADETTPEAPSGGDETILLVEDDKQVITLIRRALSEAGYRVLTAANGAEALELFRREALAIQLVLTDVVMPHLGGLELAEQLKQINPGLPVLFMSGYIEDPFVSEELERRPDLVLLKPFSPTEVRMTVRRILDRGAA